MPEFLIENDAFNSILCLIEFFDLNLRKYAIKVCLRLSKHIKNFIIFKDFILPAIPNLTNLTKFSGNSELEKFILDSAIGCFYNILKTIKMNKLEKNNKEIFQQLNQQGLVQNLFEVVLNVINLNTKNNIENKGNENYLSDFNSTNKNFTKANNNINMNYSETLKKIFTIFEFLSLKSDEISNSFLDIESYFKSLNFNMSIFEVINAIIDSEIGINNYDEGDKNNCQNLLTRENHNIQNKKNKIYSNASFNKIFNYVFSFMISLYPQEKCLKKIEGEVVDTQNDNYEKENKKLIHNICNNNVGYFDCNYEENEKNHNFKEKYNENNFYNSFGKNENLINNAYKKIEAEKEENNKFNNENNQVKLKNLKILVNQIIPKSLKNFINFSSSNSCFKLLKFIKVYIISSNKELIRKTLSPMLISNIFSSKKFLLKLLKI